MVKVKEALYQVLGLVMGNDKVTEFIEYMEKTEGKEFFTSNSLQDIMEACVYYWKHGKPNHK